MSASSHLASPVVTVTFPMTPGLDPLTTTHADMRADIERYLQRVAPGAHTIKVCECETSGVVYRGTDAVATFDVAPLGSIFGGLHSLAVAA